MNKTTQFGVNKAKKIKIFALIVISLLLIFKACYQGTPIGEQITLSGRTMGTTYHVKYIVPAKLQIHPEQVQQQIDTVLKEVNRQMSTFIPSSEISQFNQFKAINQLFPISADFAYVVATALELNQTTQGALDITIGPLVNIWNFGATKHTDKAPTAKQVAEKLKAVGIDKLKLSQDKDQFYLSKSVPELYVDLSAIAKGFGVDKVAQVLTQLGIKNYLVEIGGEIFAQGVNEKGVAWQIGIEHPQYTSERSVQNIVSLSGKAMATSGDYRNYFEQDGKRFTHEISPSTGYPVQHHLASITVIADNCTLADGLSTGLFVLGEEKALEVAEAQNLAVYLIIKQGDKFITKSSTAFQKLEEK